MKYNKMLTGTFLNRPNRFCAEVEIAGKQEMVHVKNTGRCRELLLPDARIFLEEAENPNRKTRFSLISVYKDSVLVNMDSQAPNAVVEEALLEGRIAKIGAVSYLKREQRFGSSRFDFYYETKKETGYIEVKGVTLEVDGIAMFPDAPTQRGTKHLRELIAAQAAGFKATAIFVIQMKGVTIFRPNWERDADFCQALLDAKAAGVRILAYDCLVGQDELILDAPTPIDLSR